MAADLRARLTSTRCVTAVSGMPLRFHSAVTVATDSRSVWRIRSTSHFVSEIRPSYVLRDVRLLLRQTCFKTSASFAPLR